MTRALARAGGDGQHGASGDRLFEAVRTEISMRVFARGNRINICPGAFTRVDRAFVGIVFGAFVIDHAGRAHHPVLRDSDVRGAMGQHLHQFGGRQIVVSGQPADPIGTRRCGNVPLAPESLSS